MSSGVDAKSSSSQKKRRHYSLQCKPAGGNDSEERLTKRQHSDATPVIANYHSDPQTPSPSPSNAKMGMGKKNDLPPTLSTLESNPQMAVCCYTWFQVLTGIGCSVERTVVVQLTRQQLLAVFRIMRNSNMSFHDVLEEIKSLRAVPDSTVEKDLFRIECSPAYLACVCQAMGVCEDIPVNGHGPETKGLTLPPDVQAAAKEAADARDQKASKQQREEWDIKVLMALLSGYAEDCKAANTHVQRPLSPTLLASVGLHYPWLDLQGKERVIPTDEQEDQEKAKGIPPSFDYDTAASTRRECLDPNWEGISNDDPDAVGFFFEAFLLRACAVFQGLGHFPLFFNPHYAEGAGMGPGLAITRFPPYEMFCKASQAGFQCTCSACVPSDVHSVQAEAARIGKMLLGVEQ
jgi:hypothetical protein